MVKISDLIEEVELVVGQHYEVLEDYKNLSLKGNIVRFMWSGRFTNIEGYNQGKKLTQWWGKGIKLRRLSLEEELKLK